MSTQLLYGLILLLIPTSAGIITLRLKNLNVFVTKLLLSFSGAYLLGMCFSHLLPEVYHDLGKTTGMWILLGFFIQLALEFLSKGVEHGHMHVHGQHHYFPWALLISLCIHSFLEGFPLTGHASHHHHENSMIIGIGLHKIPVAIALASLLKKANLNTTVQYGSILLFAIMAPFGLFSQSFFNPSQLETFIPISLAILIGVLLHVATTILFEVNENHKFNALKLITIIIGVFLSFVLS